MSVVALGSRVPSENADHCVHGQALIRARLPPSAQPQNAISYTPLYYSEDLHNVWWSHTCCLTWPPWEDTISRLCPTFALLCRRSALICPTGQTSFTNNILKLRGLSRDLLFICIHQYHPAATVTPGTLNLGCWPVASITKRVHYPFCCFMSFFSGLGTKSGPCLQIVVCLSGVPAGVNWWRVDQSTYWQ